MWIQTSQDRDQWCSFEHDRTWKIPSKGKFLTNWATISISKSIIFTSSDLEMKRVILKYYLSDNYSMCFELLR